MTFGENAKAAVRWILRKLLEALAWLTALVAISGLLKASPTIGLLALSFFVPLMMIGVAAQIAVRDWRDSRRPSTWIEGRGRATLVREDDFGKLWRLGSRSDGEQVRVVEVVNATRAPDGSYHHYFLQVPPDLRTPREAVAWTFGFERARKYVPAAES